MSTAKNDIMTITPAMALSNFADTYAEMQNTNGPKAQKTDHRCETDKLILKNLREGEFG